MCKNVKRLICLCLCLAMLACWLPQIGLPVAAADANDIIPQKHYGEYDTLSMVYDQGGCYSMQGMTLDADYTYCAKIGDNDSIAFIMRTRKSDGYKELMINASTGGYYFYNLGHANALDLVSCAGASQMFVTGGTYLIRLTMSGRTLTTAGTYTFSINGTATGMTAVQIMSASDREVTVLAKSGRTLYTGTLDPTASSGNIELTRLCTLNVSSVRLKGTVTDFSTFTQQGFAYHDGKVFLPLTGNAYVETINTSVVLVYDLEGATGEIKNDPTLSFRIISGTYAGLFEIEDVDICQESGKLYFNSNRRKTSSDTDYDGCSYFYGYVYDPSMSSTTADDYRWEMQDNVLTSMTDNGNTYNLATQFHGTVTNNIPTHGLYNLSRAVRLYHDDPWVVEWKSSGDFGSTGAMLLATGKNSKVANAPFLFRYKQSNIIALGYYDGTSQHNNYGIRLSDHGIDGTAEHTYRLTNKIASDGSNMVYLSVDGVELGAMNNYYIGVNAQGTTSNWVSGQDFAFSYIGSYNHPLTNCDISYLQVWANGAPDTTPNNYRWEASDSLVYATGTNLTANPATIYSGSISGGVHSSAAYRLSEEIDLRHDRPWSLQWEAEGTLSGGTFLLAASDGGNTENAPFLFRYSDTGLIALGYRGGSRHNNFGIDISDHGIDGTAKHTYRLTNKIAADGSNMVYLYVDNVCLGAMNNAFNGISALGTTSDWLNGKDLTFDYVGNRTYPVKGTVSSLQVWEAGAPCTVQFVNDDGTVLSSKTYVYGQMPTAPANPTKTDSNGYSYTFTGWDQTISEVTGDVTYTATYSGQANYFTVKFINDGTVISTQQVAYGETPTVPANPTRAATAQYTYTFTGWNINPGPITSDTTFVATYSRKLNSYTVIFQDDDGTVLSNAQVPYGTVPTEPAAPTKEPTSATEYTFVGWNQEVVAVTGETTYMAVYTTSSHTFGSYEITLAPTCTAIGQRVWSCNTCSYSYTEAVAKLGHSYSSVVTPPTCSEQGYTTHTCTTCGDVYTDTPISPLGHSYSSVVTAPTCGNKGYTTHTCTVCSHSYTDSETAALGHSYNEGVVSVNPTCLDAGVLTYTCGTCGHNFSQGIPATGHNYVSGSCANCGEAEPVVDYYLFGYINGADYACEGDSENMGIYKFVDGKLTVTFTQNSYVAVKTTGNGCWYMTEGWAGDTVTSVTLYDNNTLFAPDKLFVPGNVQVTFTLVKNSDGSLTLSYTKAAPTITAKNISLSFEDEILLNVYFTTTDVVGAVNYGLLTFSEKVSTPSHANAISVNPGYYESNGYLGVTTPGIPAKKLGDTVYFAVYAELADGTYVYSKCYHYSPYSYAYSLLSKSTTTQDMKNLIVAMLNYGAAAQVYFNYNTANPVNASLTAEQKAFVADYNADMLDGLTTCAADKKGTLFGNGNTGFGKRTPSVNFEGAFSVNFYFSQPKATVGSDVTFYVWDKATYNSVDTLLPGNAIATSTCSFDGTYYMGVVEGIAAKEVDETFYCAAVYTGTDGNTYVSGVIAYSLGYYLENQANGTAMPDFAKATGVYAYYAKQNFYE